MRTPVGIALFLPMCLVGTILQMGAIANPGCDVQRYRQSVFSLTDLVSDQPYASAKSLAGAQRNLSMDIYLPRGDTLSRRPVIVLAHGGAFFSGNKADLAPLCRWYAQRGYVAASIAYRLIDTFVTDSIAMAEGAIMAINDMKAAVRFFREDAAGQNRFRIDTNAIFAGGVSAGAIMAAHVGILDTDDAVPTYIAAHIAKHGGHAGNSSANTQYSSTVHGVVAFSGALLRDTWVDAGDAPIFMVHEEFDSVVPCGYAQASAVSFPMLVYGSCRIDAAAESLGLKRRLHLLKGSRSHVGYLDDGGTAGILAQSAEFLAEIMCNAPVTSALTGSKIRLWEAPLRRNIGVPDFFRSEHGCDAIGRRLSPQFVTPKH